MIIDMKTCMRCLNPRNTDDFPVGRGKQGKRRSLCSWCIKESKKESGRKHYSSNKEAYIKRAKEAEARLDPKIRRRRMYERKRTWERKNPDKVSLLKKRYYEKYRDSLKTKVNAYRKLNRKKANFWEASREARKRKQTPKWVDLSQVEKIYTECPIEMTIDHIIPLNGKTVCGLHVPDNLRQLSRSENSRKGNKLDQNLLRRIFEKEFLNKKTSESI